MPFLNAACVLSILCTVIRLSSTEESGDLSSTSSVLLESDSSPIAYEEIVDADEAVSLTATTSDVPIVEETTLTVPTTASIQNSNEVPHETPESRTATSTSTSSGGSSSASTMKDRWQPPGWDDNWEERENDTDPCTEYCVKTKVICPQDLKDMATALVSVQKSSKDHVMVHVCSGLLIGMYSVLTAAHCIDCRDLQTDSFEYYVVGNDGVPRRVADVTIHPEARGVAYHDLALMKLEKRFTEDKGSITIFRLGSTSPPDNLTCNLLYWTSPTSQVALNRVTLTTDTCDVLNEELTGSTLLCASGTDNCVADPGSPLLCEESAVGIITNLDKSDCEYSVPIYTDLTRYTQWIEDNSPNKVPLKGSNIRANIYNVVLTNVLSYLAYRHHRVC